MATITITRNINAYGTILVPVFQRNSLSFRCERGSEVGTYATIKIGAYEFRAIKEYTQSTYDDYIIDVTSILANITPFVSEIDNMETPSTTPILTLYSSDGTVLTTLNHPTIILSRGYDDVHKYDKMVDVYLKGVSRSVYHNGKMCFFWKGTSAIHPITCGGVTINFEMYANDYNIFDYTVSELDALPKTGTVTSSGQPTLSVPVFYKIPFGSEEIAWLNRDGCWSFWNFRQLTKELRVKKSNDVATYYQTNISTISLSRQISAEKTVEYTFDTLAYDTAHFEQLCEIQESLAVIWNEKLCRVKACDTKSAVCKQNLKFTLILEIDENIAGY